MADTDAWNSRKFGDYFRKVRDTTRVRCCLESEESPDECCGVEFTYTSYAAIEKHLYERHQAGQGFMAIGAKQQMITPPAKQSLAGVRRKLKTPKQEAVVEYARPKRSGMGIKRQQRSGGERETPGEHKMVVVAHREDVEEEQGERPIVEKREQSDHQLNGEEEREETGQTRQGSWRPSVGRFQQRQMKRPHTGDGEPLFEGSRTDCVQFCAEFCAIAQTFNLSDRACVDLLSLVRRMAPPNPELNAVPNDFEEARLRLYDMHLPEVAAAVTVPVAQQPTSVASPMYSSPAEMPPKIENVEGGGEDEEQGEDFVVVVDDFGQQRQKQQQQQFMRHQHGLPGERPPVVMAHVIGSLNKLSREVGSLKRQYARETEGFRESGGPEPPHASANQQSPEKRERGKLRAPAKHDFDQRRPKYFVKVYDEHDQVVPICDLSREDMINTVAVCREDQQMRITYLDMDITERVLHKLDISLYLHNPSYCGRAVADALFNPEFLSRFHILSEGQSSSRSHRETLSPELTKVFYDTLRKLGASRIIADDQFGWMEQARDSVNQRNRDIKIPGCRRKFFQNSDPIFE